MRAKLRGLVRDAARSYGDPKADSLLVHGDNLTALTRLAPAFAETIRCAYLDPPFNTGRVFPEYTDRATREAWTAGMRDRLQALHPLLAVDGACFVEIDDNALGPLLSVMDEVFGEANRVTLVTVVRSASTGHKAKNRAPVHVTDFLLVYAKDKRRWKYRPQWRMRRGYDRAYGTFLVDPDAPHEAWRFVPLGREAKRAGAKTRAEIEAFALENARHVVRFAQPRYDAVSQEARRWIDDSRARPDAVLRLERPGHPPMILRAGNRVLFLADKVREVNGERVIVEPLTNVWDDVPFQGIAKEGGVVFTRNKKPERLLARVLSMATDPGDWVLDPFLGSGTTAAVALKMGRRFVGVERGLHVDELCLPRLRRVVDGLDTSGITREEGWRGGGGFTVYVES